MISELLKKRDLPPLSDRRSMLDILLREQYGYMPCADSVSFENTDIPKTYNKMFGNKAAAEKISVTAHFGEKSFSFPIEVFYPKKEGKHPFIVFLALNTPSGIYYPLEEIIDNGFGMARVVYTDVTSDNGDFTNGLAGVLFENGQRKSTDPGKLAMWAWSASRALDFLETRSYADASRVTVCGHSRLGKTALLAAATDERFYCGHSNNSGCSGAALARENTGETVADICRNFPYWFCENYESYAGRERQMPFDQHFLIASIAPRKVYVSSAEEDLWADPVNEFLSCVAASPAFEKGFVHNGQIAKTGERLHGGDIGYHKRSGTHFHTREDWLTLMDFLKIRT